MKSPGEYALMWANKHINNLTWPELVTLIREEAVEDYKTCQEVKSQTVVEDDGSFVEWVLAEIAKRQVSNEEGKETS